jgi:hypothetical protein
VSSEGDFTRAWIPHSPGSASPWQCTVGVSEARLERRRLWASRDVPEVSWAVWSEAVMNICSLVSSTALTFESAFSRGKITNLHSIVPFR